MARRGLVLALLLCGAGVAGCGGIDEPDYAERTPPVHVGAAPLPAISAHDRRALRVAAAHPTRDDARRVRGLLRAWTRAVQDNDDATAARFFDPPVLVDAGSVFTLENRSQVVDFNSSLQCALRLHRVEPDGRFLVGTFTLAKRTKHACPSAGRTQKLALAVQDGKIVEWRLMDPGAHATPGPAVPEDAPPQPPQEDA
jgi:hypothetical protein